MKTDVFALRHIGIQGEEQSQMLKTVGVESLDQLILETIPADIRLKKALDLAPAMSEHDYLSHIEALSQKNQVFKSYIGLGYHQSITPSVIKRNILENPGWYTAYTPYQAEIAQGRLEALINFQTMVCELTGMDLANASLLDESTAAAEAMTMLYDLRTRDQKKQEAMSFFVSEDILPQTLSLLETRATPLGIQLEVGPIDAFAFEPHFYGAILQYPGKNGAIGAVDQFMEKAKTTDIKVAFAADILSLTMLTAPGELGADVVVGTTQRFGIPLGYGGPHAAFFATREDYKRSIPGRIIGLTKDTDGLPAYRMALQTREQHIKRDKATSNICTAQVLLAVMAGMYAVYHGPLGLLYIAQGVHHKTVAVSKALESLGYTQQNKNYFDTLLVSAPAKEIKALAEAHKVNFNYLGTNQVGISINEATSVADAQEIVAIFAAAKGQTPPTISVDNETKVPQHLARKTAFLSQKVFNSYHSETALMRYIKQLERKDLALNHSMISLGSCTMKLNAASEMLPLSWAQWGSMHPFVPIDQAAGYQEVCNGLEKALNEITGFAATSLQPNSGAQGEYAGLMVIKAYHEIRGDSHRNICLIPASAHGTNPASAVMAGMKVVVTKSTEEGNIDIDDLREKAEFHKDNLAALMVTYPSTHGVYEASIKEITQIIHDNGGQVYMDGANMNAQVGLTNPGNIGADVCHLNLHKTFAIPHGGGGPGMGPIGVAAHLAPFLPNHVVTATSRDKGMKAVSAAPWGSASILLISYAYIKMMGGEGLTQATKIASLNANYIKSRLEKEYPVLYTVENGFAAHEIILDTRMFKQTAHVEAEDIAKRLIDYGFHAPTLSFPVAGTLMIEPTESESKEELDRYCDALLQNREEIRAIEEEQDDKEDNVLKMAPHTIEEITGDWNHPYSREEAVYPLEYLRQAKFWPMVSRVNNTYGDRNLVCACLPTEAYAEG